MATNDAEDLQVAKAKILQTFDKHDTNKDGIISRDEMYTLLKVLDQSLEIDSIDALLEALDTNGDGLVDTKEFVDWVLQTEDGQSVQTKEDAVAALLATHVFLTSQEEAKMEQFALFSLKAEQNAAILADLGLGELKDSSLAVLSMGSSSTQVYDSADMARSFPVGTKVSSKEACQELGRFLKEARAVPFTRILLLNSIGYLCSESDAHLVPLAELASREKGKVLANLHAALAELLPAADMQVLNRVKDSATKRYKYAQVTNDFSEALASGKALHLCKDVGMVAQEQDAIIDWGGSSLKVFVDGKRVATQLLDANALLCEGGVLHKEKLDEAIKDVKLFVLQHVPNARNIFIAQTGKARELFFKELDQMPDESKATIARWRMK